MTTAWYLDTSAAMKLARAEAESAALRTWVASTEERIVSSDLVRTELLRAVARAEPAAMTLARHVLASIELASMSTQTFETAALLQPPVLRTLDALHLAAAIEWGDRLSGIVTYDQRLAQAAAANGVATISPS